MPLPAAFYALAFGSFAAEFYQILGLPQLGIDQGGLKLIFMTLIVIAFTYLNYRGASETGTVGNIVTVTKIHYLGVVCRLWPVGDDPEPGRLDGTVH